MILNQTIKCNKDITVNPNLLANWYFLAPVNQRGIANWTNRDGQITYAPDRWKSAWDTVGKIDESGLTLHTLENGVGFLFQHFADEQTYNELSGKTLTLSIMYKNCVGDTLPQLAYGWDSYIDIPRTSEVNVLSHTFVADTSDLERRLCVIRSFFDASTYITVIAVKLELGSQQTLAHQENGVWVLNEIPDYDKELFKCMKYFQRFRSGSGYWTQNLPNYADAYNPQMRINPSKSTMTIDGISYKTATADL